MHTAEARLFAISYDDWRGVLKRVVFGGKFEHHRKLASLAEYLTVEQVKPHIEQWSRQPDGRSLLTEYDQLSHFIELAAVGCALPLAEVDDKIEFAAG